MAVRPISSRAVFGGPSHHNSCGVVQLELGSQVLRGLGNCCIGVGTKPKALICIKCDYWPMQRSYPAITMMNDGNIAWKVKWPLPHFDHVIKPQSSNLLHAFHKIVLAWTNVMAFSVTGAEQVKAVQQGIANVDPAAHVEKGALAAGDRNCSMGTILSAQPS